MYTGEFILKMGAEDRIHCNSIVVLWFCGFVIIIDKKNFIRGLVELCGFEIRSFSTNTNYIK